MNMGWSRQTAVGVALVFVGLLGCTKVKDHSNKNEHLLSGTLWFQTSGENRALQLQAFNLAKRILDEDLKDRKKKGKRAVVVDVDETVEPTNTAVKVVALAVTVVVGVTTSSVVVASVTTSVG